MLFISVNLKKLRKQKDLTQEEVADMLHVTPQSVSKWERGESYPDITLLPALANLFETSIDALIGMDAIRSDEIRYNLHKSANEHMLASDYPAAANTYEDALRTFPNDSGFILGMASAQAFLGETWRAISLSELGLATCESEKHRATARAALCFLYLKAGEAEKAIALARTLPHTRESREEILPLVIKGLDDTELYKNLRNIILGL